MDTFKRPTIVEFVNFSMSMSLCQAGCPRYYVSPAACDNSSMSQGAFQVIVYGVCLALYTWRTASRPREPSQIDEEMRGTEPGLRDIPADVPEGLSSPAMRHSVSEDILSSIAGTGSGDSRRGSARKSRLEKRLPDHFF